MQHVSRKSASIANVFSGTFSMPLFLKLTLHSRRVMIPGCWTIRACEKPPPIKEEMSSLVYIVKTWWMHFWQFVT